MCGMQHIIMIYRLQAGFFLSQYQHVTLRLYHEVKVHMLAMPSLAFFKIATLKQHWENHTPGMPDHNHKITKLKSSTCSFQSDAVEIPTSI